MHDFQAISILGSGLIAFAMAWLLAVRLIPAPLAHPNARSLHTNPVPRIGGIAIWVGWSITWCAVPAPWHWILPFALVVAVSLVDDFRALPAAVRLSVHALSAVAAVWPMTGANLWILVFLALVVMWMANLFNFMDGADGLAATMGVIGFGAYASAAAGADRALPCAALAAACAGFLFFNRPPAARLFMGDVGAVGLGFLAGLFGVQGVIEGIWPWWFPPLVFAPFIFDATATLVRRSLRRAPLASAHRDHFYQRAILVQSAHGSTVLVYIGWMAGCAVLALAGLRWIPEFGALLLLLAAVGFGTYCWRIEKRWTLWSAARHAG
ncbi:MAG: hypothetical protein ABIR04_10800 [Cypionkella sp.]